MGKIKNFIANIPIYIGLYVRMFSDFMMTIGFRLHISLGTEAGAKLKQVEAAMKQLAEQYHKLNPQAQGQKAPERFSKLADIIKGNPDGSNSGNNQV